MLLFAFTYRTALRIAFMISIDSAKLNVVLRAFSNVLISL